MTITHEDRLLPCPNGHEAALEEIGAMFFVVCVEAGCTWAGGSHYEPAHAARDWNSVMRPFHKKMGLKDE